MDVPPDGVSTLRHYLEALWRRKWLVLAPLVLLPLVALVATLRQDALYEASADVLVNRQEVATTSLVGETPALDNADRTLQTNARLARVPSVIERTLAVARETDVSAETLLGRSSVSSFADILRFTVTDPDPTRGARLASAYARAFVQYRTELDTAGLARTLDGLRSRLDELEAAGRIESPLYVTLADREQQLQSLKTLRASNVSVVMTPATDDTTQVAPRPRRDTAVALAAGLVVGLILAFLAESLSTKPRSKEEFEALLGMPFLARVTFGERGGDSLRHEDRRGRHADAIHTLRTNLELANAGASVRTIMITSPRGGELKSAIASELAIAFAHTGRHVALVDLDLRHRSLSRIMGVEDRDGITTLLQGECALADALVAAPLDALPDGGLTAASNGRRDLAMLDVLGSGPPAVAPAELVGSKRVAAALSELELRADVVLVDVPPLLEAPDAAAVAPAVDGMIVVVGSREARGPELADVQRTTGTWPVARLGFVLADGSDARSSLHDVRQVTLRSTTSAAEPEHVA